MINLDAMNASMNKFLIQQKYVNTALYLFLILYAGLAAPKLPSYISNLFDNVIFRMVVLFLIAYLSAKDVRAALLVSIGLIITLITLNHHKVNAAVTKLLRLQESFMPRGSEKAYFDIVTPMPSQRAIGIKNMKYEEPFDGTEYAEA